MGSELENALESVKTSLHSPLPMALPPTHLCTAREFADIAESGELTPTHCSVFDQKLLYFFYGGIFYRSRNSQHPTREAVRLPVAFVFGPSILPLFECYYPFDTGAMENKVCGDWNDKLDPFKDRFRVSSNGDFRVPSQLVGQVYQTNEKYLRGEVSILCKSGPDPLTLLYEFLSADLTAYGIDRRQMSIECHSTRPVPLGRELLWVGYPRARTPDFLRILERTEPHVPKSYEYDWSVTFTPAEVARELESEARRVVIEDYVHRPGETG